MTMVGKGSYVRVLCCVVLEFWGFGVLGFWRCGVLGEMKGDGSVSSSDVDAGRCAGVVCRNRQ